MWNPPKCGAQSRTLFLDLSFPVFVITIIMWFLYCFITLDHNDCMEANYIPNKVIKLYFNLVILTQFLKETNILEKRNKSELFYPGRTYSLTSSLFVEDSKRERSHKIDIQFSSVAQLCLTLCDTMDSSTPGQASLSITIS